jgi:hypothetical protein
VNGYNGLMEEELRQKCRLWLMLQVSYGVNGMYVVPPSLADAAQEVLDDPPGWTEIEEYLAGRKKDVVLESA